MNEMYKAMYKDYFILKPMLYIKNNMKYIKWDSLINDKSFTYRLSDSFLLDLIWFKYGIFNE